VLVLSRRFTVALGLSDSRFWFLVSLSVNDYKDWSESLWAPWRVEYFERRHLTPDFLEVAARSSSDAEHFVVYRRKSGFLIMNLYPYSVGHLMAVPYRKVGDLEALTSAERCELLDLSIYAKRLLREVVKAEGFNIGFNLGTAAGAGVDSHVHLHVVPRWTGDHNFMPVLGGTRIISDGLRPLYDKLVAAVGRIEYPED
jgi:ATP adenylyltransferase